MKTFYKIVIHLTIVFLIITIYCIIIKNSPIFEWTIYLITILLSAYSILKWRSLWDILKSDSFNNYVSLISIEIALIAFIQTSIQVEKNNTQFEQNRIASEKLYAQQIEHSEKLNQQQIDNSKKLNETLTAELIRLQEINSKQSESAENQLSATKSQIELSEQTLQDYLFDTKPELSIESTKITNTDTLENSELQLTISSVIKNMGRREADSVEIRNTVIFEDRSIGPLSISKETEFFTGNRAIQNHYYPTMSKNLAKDFYYWIQVKYFDKKTGSQFDRSFYFRYYESARGYDFYFAKNNDKKILREIIDKELAKQNYTLTDN